MIISLWGGNIWAIPTTVLLPGCPCMCYDLFTKGGKKKLDEDDFEPMTEDNESP